MISSETVSEERCFIVRDKREIRGRGTPLLGTLPFILLCVTLAFFWDISQEGHLTPESGLGYILGVGAAACTLLLLIYPCRKRLRIMRNWGSIKVWFSLHMFLGVLAPIFVMAHANFQFGSLNSAIALTTMLVVAGSGVIGRYFYTRIHYGLYGKRAKLEELRSTIADNAHQVNVLLAHAPDFREKMVNLANRSLQPSPNVLRAALRILFIDVKTSWMYLLSRCVISRHARNERRRLSWSARRLRREKRMALQFIYNYLHIIRKTVQFTFYERVFSLWHILHIPLFVLLLLVMTAHVVAVHMF